jgi:hypothetical protein
MEFLAGLKTAAEEQVSTSLRMELNHMKPFITPEITALGKKVLRFQFEGLDRSDFRKSLIGHNVTAYAMPEGQTHRASWIFQIVLDNGKLLEFSSACTQIVDWQEVGSLNIFVADMSLFATTGIVTTLPRVAMTPLLISALDILIYEDDDIVSECGLVIYGQDDLQIVVAAGIPPGSVSTAIPHSMGYLQPQFSVADCMRVCM